jgi:hypothetical protein
MYTNLYYIVLRQLRALCDVYLFVLMFVYQFELVDLRALWSAVETCYGLSCLLIAIEHNRKIGFYIYYVSPFVRLCLPVWNMAAHTGRSIVEFILEKFTKVYWKIPHFGKSNEYAGRYIVRPELICHLCDLSTNISVLGCGDRMLILR